MLALCGEKNPVVMFMCSKATSVQSTFLINLFFIVAFSLELTYLAWNGMEYYTFIWFGLLSHTSFSGWNQKLNKRNEKLSHPAHPPIIYHK